MKFLILPSFVSTYEINIKFVHTCVSYNLKMSRKRTNNMVFLVVEICKLYNFRFLSKFILLISWLIMMSVL